MTFWRATSMIRLDLLFNSIHWILFSHAARIWAASSGSLLGATRSCVLNNLIQSLYLDSKFWILSSAGRWFSFCSTSHWRRPESLSGQKLEANIQWSPLLPRWTQQWPRGRYRMDKMSSTVWIGHCPETASRRLHGSTVYSVHNKDVGKTTSMYEVHPTLHSVNFILTIWITRCYSVTVTLLNEAFSCHGNLWQSFARCMRKLKRSGRRPRIARLKQFLTIYGIGRDRWILGFLLKCNSLSPKCIARCVAGKFARIAKIPKCLWTSRWFSNFSKVCQNPAFNWPFYKWTFARKLFWPVTFAAKRVLHCWILLQPFNMLSVSRSSRLDVLESPYRRRTPARSSRRSLFRRF